MERTGEAYVNRDEEDEMEISGYSPCYWKLALVSLGTVCSGGFLLLFLYWLPELSVKWTCHAVPLQEARVLLLRTTDEFRTWFRIRVCSLSAPGSDPLGFPQLSESKRPLCQAVPLEDWDCEEGLLSPPIFRERTEVRFFVHHNTRYIWSVESQSFQRLTALDCRLPFSSLHTIHGSGLPRSTQDYRRLFYGANQIDVQVPSLPKLLIREVLNPFYIFQVFSMVLWSLDNYYLYASAILFMSLVSICSSLYTIRKQYILLHDMVATHNIIRVTVNRGPHETEEIFSTELVPGDVLLVPPEGLTVPCDAVLLSGTAIANESMLTGESVPVTKTALPDPSQAANGPRQDPAYDPEEHKRHTLFCGTSIIQTRYYSGEPVRALVIRTGFSTSKGQLVCSILFPKPTDFRLYRDAYRFLLCLVGVAGIGMLYSVIRSVRQAEPIGRIILESLDILTITVPPALPAAMTAGVVYAQRRLRREHIFSISPQRINVCGQINLMCFDKTGTLTEDGLDFWGFVQAQDGCFLPPGQDLRSISLTSSPFVAAMAACHSLTTIGGRLSGDPLDLKMFEATGWKVYQIGLLVQFPFSSALQRMSVVTRTLGEKRLVAYMKGAPETVGSLCRKETVPENFSTVLESYTRRGLRVIALARRRLESKYTWHKVQHISRDIIEINMDFLGLVMLQNKLKPETVPVLAELRRACIRPVMVTGDNLLTAISVGRECGMIPAKGKVILTEALPPRDGQPATINWQYTDELPTLEIPDKASKQEIKLMLDEEELPPAPRPGIPEISYHFAISGKSFSLLLCGTIYARMAPDQKTQLVESLQKMDYYVGMCGDGANDCGVMSLNSAWKDLVPQRPPTSLVSPQLLLSVFTQILLSLGFQVGAFLLVQGQPWYCQKENGACGLDSSNITLLSPNITNLVNVTARQESQLGEEEADGEDDSVHSFENTTLFYISCFQYIAVALAFSKGRPFRQPIRTNENVPLPFSSREGRAKKHPIESRPFFLPPQLACVPYEWRLILLVLALSNLVLSVSLELELDEMAPGYSCRRQAPPRAKYKRLAQELLFDPDWPPQPKTSTKGRGPPAESSA
ncbi:hypothetical protein JD844_000730 [Phrynosoma platyrhinos]|uniref:Cation-transporting ATPase n=1 Tax=Phrynosoma platyrhinos TaxID=52577 RepID=A0ABQ7T9B7_PHRPL|nr:hypothetical protein JD844_000730 [Phrynosoma platyrhinos]